MSFPHKQVVGTPLLCRLEVEPCLLISEHEISLISLIIPKPQFDFYPQIILGFFRVYIWSQINEGQVSYIRVQHWAIIFNEMRFCV